jgi:hypothetical protein
MQRAAYAKAPNSLTVDQRPLQPLHATTVYYDAIASLLLLKTYYH